jgi:SSS family solute:Na+ symporter
MTANFFGAIAAWTVCFLVTIGVSLLTRAKPAPELEGLVYSVTPQPGGGRRWSLANPRVAAIVVLAAAVALNLWFW